MHTNTSTARPAPVTLRLTDPICSNTTRNIPFLRSPAPPAPTSNAQAQPIDPNLTAKLLGRGVAVSPIVTVEPRRRKFHKAITLSMPAPKAHSQGMINQYSGNAPTLRLLCSITGTFYVCVCVVCSLPVSDVCVCACV